MGPLGGGGMFPGKPWSRTVNAWIILLCVAVFVIDGFMGGAGTGRSSGYIETGRYWVPDGDVWVEVTGTPYRPDSIRPQQTHLGVSPVSEVVQIRTSDGQTASKTIYGIPVLDQHNQVVAVAEATGASGLMRWFHFSTKRVIGGAELWRLITFQFLHADLYHLLFNMMALYFFGSLIENMLGSKRYLAFYLICGAAGGILYLLLNLAGYMWVEQLGLRQIPGLLDNAPGMPLIGASAGVFGVLIGGAFLAPMARVLIFFMIPMRLSTLAWLLIGISVASILFGWDNAGGEAAHLGGAIAGWAMIRHPDQLHRFFDWLGRFDPTSRRFRARPAAGEAGTADIDRILAKISRDGLQSLTKAEKRTLQEASEGDAR
jgi:membrane associated rhomboid family serine protease